MQNDFNLNKPYEPSAVPKARKNIDNMDGANAVYALNLNETVNIINIGRGMKNNLTARQVKIMSKLKKQ